MVWISRPKMNRKAIKRENRLDRLRTLGRILDEGERFLLLTHQNPDGDALGSLLGLGEGLLSAGKQVVMYYGGVAPDMFTFLSGFDKVAKDPGNPEDYDAIILLDCHELDRVDDAALIMAGHGKILVIDHHVSSVPETEDMLIDTGASAAGELVFDLLQILDIKITRDIANNLFTAIATDTGHFSYENTSAYCLGIAARLVEAGAEPWKIYQNLYMERSSGRMRLLGMALSSLEFSYSGRVGVITITRDMMNATETDSVDTDGFVEYPRSIKGVDLAVLFKESSNGLCKVSLRSLGTVNAAALAKEFGGGGHMQAAGFSVSGGLEDVKSRVVAEIGKYLD